MAEPRAVLYLLDASSRFEERLLREWVLERCESGRKPDECIAIPPSRRRRRRVRSSALEVALAGEDDPLLVPLRIGWMPKLRDGQRAARLSDLLRFGDPRDPGALRQRWIASRNDGRCHFVEGEPARISELRERWRVSGGVETAGLADFVVRQAVLALERAERRLRGARYKVPRFVREEILRRPAFRAALERLTRTEGRPVAAIARESAKYLTEIAASHSRFVIDLVAHLIHLMYTRGYGELVYESDEMARVATLSQQHPVVFLPTHKSNLDHLVLQYALHENGLPPNHTAGGINMNFFPVGQLVRRSGVFFIRRSFKDNAVYKQVLASYIDYLIEKRFPLEWYIEGGRSRSGKLLPPRFGMLAYVVDAWRRKCSEDVMLIPVSIAYDQIVDVGSYSDEQRGGEKRKESFGWFVGLLRSLGSGYGDIHIRFGDALSLREALGSPEAAPNVDERELALQKLAFEVSVRINRATPLTPTSIVTLALLGAGDRALSVAETRRALHILLDYVRERKLPVTFELGSLDGTEGVRAALDALVATKVVECYDRGYEPVYRIGEDQELTAAYYRNSVVHFFVTGSIAELALLRAGQPDIKDPTATFWDEAMALRDLLKFEFFFPDKETFRAELRSELDSQNPEWGAQLAEGGERIQQLVQGFRPFMAHRTLRPFLESYQVVAERLARWKPHREVIPEQLFNECLGLGKQYRLQRRIHSADSISKVLFKTALELAGNRGLLELDEADPESLRGRREEFAAEIRSALQRVEVISALGAARRSGWIR